MVKISKRESDEEGEKTIEETKIALNMPAGEAVGARGL